MQRVEKQIKSIIPFILQSRLWNMKRCGEYENFMGLDRQTIVLLTCLLLFILWDTKTSNMCIESVELCVIINSRITLDIGTPNVFVHTKANRVELQ